LKFFIKFPMSNDMSSIAKSLKLAAKGLDCFFLSPLVFVLFFFFPTEEEFIFYQFKFQQNFLK